MKTVEAIVEYSDKNLSAYIDGAPIAVVGDSISEIKPLGPGFINDTFVIKTGGEHPVRYILHMTDKTFSKVIIPIGQQGTSSSQCATIVIYYMMSPVSGYFPFQRVIKIENMT